jgi:hypothetical protein
VIRGARVRCVQGTCRIRKIEVRFNVRNKVFNGFGRGKRSIAKGKSVVLKTTMPKRLVRRLKVGRVSGTVTFVVTVSSSNGTRTTTGIRTGLRR